MTAPLFFNEYFQKKEDVASPFLTPSGRKWSKSLPLKAAFASAALLAISQFPGISLPLSQLLLCLIYFLVGVPPLIEAIEDLSNFDINIDVLMTLAAFSSTLLGSGAEGALLLVLFALSGAMEETVETKAKDALLTLNRLAPQKATVLGNEGLLIERSLEDIKVGEKIWVKSGEMIPLDGTVIEGICAVNLQLLTGESLPQKTEPGKNVPAGAYTVDGAITIQVTHTKSDSTLAKIIELVTEAQEAKPLLQKWFDRLSHNYALTIILISFVVAASFPFLLSIPFLGSEGSLYRALSFLIAASPCALIIAIPIAYLSALSSLARSGIILKGGVILDALADCSLIAFDKTGTLTYGMLRLVSIESVNASLYSQQQAACIAFALERGAVHPIARSVLAYAEEKKLSLYPLKEYKTLPGFGVEGIVSLEKEVEVFFGLPEYVLGSINSQLKEKFLQKIKEAEGLGFLTALLQIDQEFFLFSFEDQPRAHVKETLANLKNTLGLKIAMLSGDTPVIANKVGKSLGIEQIFGGLRPQDKLSKIEALAKKETLAMVGDGVNDAPALARAHVGIAMGKVGSQTAIEAADVILLKDSIELLDWLFKKSKKTRQIVRQNLSLAGIAILSATIPALLGWLPLWLAVVVHEGGTVLVGLNALRLLGISKKP